MDTEIATGRRYKALENAAALLNMDALVPSKSTRYRARAVHDFALRGPGGARG